METRLPLITPGTRDEMEDPRTGVTLRIREAGSNIFLGRGWGVGEGCSLRSIRGGAGGGGKGRVSDFPRPDSPTAAYSASHAAPSPLPPPTG